MEIKKNIEIIDLALYLEKQKTLVIADIHLGFEENLHKQGFLVPWFQFKEIKTRLEKIFETVKPEKIVINGDLKHEFGTIPNQEWEEVLGMIDFLSENCNKLILIKGNHDNILDPIANKREVKFEETGLLLNDTYITHGHKIPNNKKFESSKKIIIGHEHPAIGLSDGVTTEIYKCFLKGTWENKELIVQPSLCLVTEGKDILKEKTLSPFLNQNLDNFEVYVVADTVRYFRKLKNLKERRALSKA